MEKLSAVCLQAAFLSLWPVLLFGQSAQLGTGSTICKSNTEACEASRQVQDKPGHPKKDTADHQYNVAACRNAWKSCDRSKLTESETIALAVAEHSHNVSNCKSGL